MRLISGFPYRSPVCIIAFAGGTTGPLPKILFFAINHPRDTVIESGTPSPPITGPGDQFNRRTGCQGPRIGPAGILYR